MPIFSREFELVRALLDELGTIKEIISGLGTETLGRSLTSVQRQAAIDARLEAAAEVSALIRKISRYGNYPILCPDTDPGMAPVIRARFPSGSYRARPAKGLTGAHKDLDEVYACHAGGRDADNLAVPGSGYRVASGLPRRRRNPGERSARSRHDDDGL